LFAGTACLLALLACSWTCTGPANLSLTPWTFHLLADTVALLMGHADAVALLMAGGLR